MTAIVLVDDHRVITRSLKAYLESSPDLKVTGIAASGEELLEHVGAWMPDVILVLAKLQVESRAQAIVQALERGLVTLEEFE